MKIYRPRADWGNAIGWFNADAQKLVGWLTPLPEVGDEFHSPMRSGRTGVFTITSVRPCWRPPDMFFAETKWSGYLDEARTFVPQNPPATGKIPATLSGPGDAQTSRGPGQQERHSR